MKLPPSQTKTNIASKTRVLASVTIFDILDINESESLISLVFSLVLKWTDLRLTYIFLKDDQDKNVIDKSQMENLWQPEIKFMLHDELTQIDKQITVEKLGESTMSADMDSLHPNETYLGSENPIHMKTMNRGKAW